MDITSIIKKPFLTEKSGLLKEKGNYYIFEVDKNASKKMIKKAIEELFKVHVEKVNTVILPGKSKRFGRTISKARKFKKAIVKLKAGEKIELVEGV
ncbi:MAG: 50S ribosomal protein L23 [Candidatus Goldbacteria bacterium]|nr:50S ribosomal protein L23 [Candidatus Goldiibacteriota bacterium]